MNEQLRHVEAAIGERRHVQHVRRHAVVEILAEPPRLHFTREIAVRLATGAKRSQILTHLLSETVLLALAAAAISLVLGYAAVRALLSLSPADLPRIGTNGSARYSYRDHVESKPNLTHSQTYTAYQGSVMNEVKYFLEDCLRKGAPPLSTLDDAITSQKMIEACEKSIEECRSPINETASAASGSVLLRPRVWSASESGGAGTVDMRLHSPI